MNQAPINGGVPTPDILVREQLYAAIEMLRNHGLLTDAQAQKKRQQITPPEPRKPA